MLNASTVALLLYQNVLAATRTPKTFTTSSVGAATPVASGIICNLSSLRWSYRYRFRLGFVKYCLTRILYGSSYYLVGMEMVKCSSAWRRELADALCH